MTLARNNTVGARRTLWHCRYISLRAGLPVCKGSAFDRLAKYMHTFRIWRAALAGLVPLNCRGPPHDETRRQREGRWRREKARDARRMVAPGLSLGGDSLEACRVHHVDAGNRSIDFAGTGAAKAMVSPLSSRAYLGPSPTEQIQKLCSPRRHTFKHIPTRRGRHPLIR